MMRIYRKLLAISDRLSLSNYVFLVFLLLLMLVSVGSILGNLVTQYPMVANLKWLVSIGLALIGFYLIHINRYIEIFKIAILALILLLVIWPSWMYGGGDNAITMLYMLLITVEVFIMIENSIVRWLFACLTVGSCVLLIVLSYKMPHLIEPDRGQNVFVDSILQIIIIFVVTALSVHIFMRKYKGQQAVLQTLNHQLVEMASIDELGQINNRRVILEELDKQLEYNKGTEWYTIMLDIDFFKSINDSKGHLVGDAIIKHFAAHVEHTVGSCGIVGRYGGDEFLIILNNSSELQAREVTVKLLQVPPYQQMILSTSGGVAKWQNGQGAHEMVESADHLLLESKRQGRNRITLWNGDVLSGDNLRQQ